MTFKEKVSMGGLCDSPNFRTVQIVAGDRLDRRQFGQLHVVQNPNCSNYWQKEVKLIYGLYLDY